MCVIIVCDECKWWGGVVTVFGEFVWWVCVMSVWWGYVVSVCGECVVSVCGEGKLGEGVGVT